MILATVEVEKNLKSAAVNNMAKHSQAAKAIRRFCLSCQGGSSVAIASCSDEECVLFLVRQCTLEELSEEINELRYIRRHCLVCAGSRSDVRKCEAKEDCPLWSYRFGVLPSTFKRVVARQREQRQSLLLPI